MDGAVANLCGIIVLLPGCSLLRHNASGHISTQRLNPAAFARNLEVWTDWGCQAQRAVHYSFLPFALAGDCTSYS